MKRNVTFNSNRMSRTEKWGLAGFFAFWFFSLLVSLGFLGLIGWAIVKLVEWVTAQ